MLSDTLAGIDIIAEVKISYLRELNELMKEQIDELMKE